MFSTRTFINIRSALRSRPLSTHSPGSPSTLPPDFRFIPSFLDDNEQRTLLKFALRKLDEAGKRSFQRKRRGKGNYDTVTGSVSDIFLPDKYYEFEEGHYDGVIINYREMHVTSWPQDPFLMPILDRLYSLLPSVPREDVQAHILHLASNGHILPHIDNLESSGSWIAAVSLGGGRVLRLKNESSEDSFELYLPSGSAYVQRDSIRFFYNHSILPPGEFKGEIIPSSPRVSIMLRDRLHKLK